MKAKFVNENRIEAWHVSLKPVNELSNIPMWFYDEREAAISLSKNLEAEYNQKVFIQNLFIKGNILDIEEIEDLCGELGIDYYDLTADLTANPSVKERRELIKPFIQYCDGFYMSDYDPNDPRKDVLSIMVFNPAKNAELA